MKPLVSCICITQNRRFFLRRAVQYFLSARFQFNATREDCELLVLDGSEQSNADLCIDEESDGLLPLLLHEVKNVRYFHEPSPPHAETGKLHNRACELAEGDVIVQWDDDDWQSPGRILQQVRALGGASKDVTSEYPSGAMTFTSQFYWYHLGERRACKARSWHHGGSAGATFAYHRKAWEACPFRDVPQGEDSFFWQDHEARGTPMIDTKDPEMVVYIRHNQNGSHATSDDFTDEDTREARRILGDNVDFYDELSEILPLAQWNDPRAPWHVWHERFQQMQRVVPGLRRR